MSASNILYYASGGTNTIQQSTNPACFNHDTKILTSNGEYVRIQDLKIGDSIKTYLHGDKKLIYKGKNTLNNGHNLLADMYSLKIPDNEDLIVTGGHSILVDSLTEEETKIELKYRKIMKIDDKFLLLACNNPDFERIIDTNVYTYYHIVLENEDKDGQYGIWANGILTETMSEDYFVGHNLL